MRYVATLLPFPCPRLRSSDVLLMLLPLLLDADYDADIKAGAATALPIFVSRRRFETTSPCCCFITRYASCFDMLTRAMLYCRYAASAICAMRLPPRGEEVPATEKASAHCHAIDFHANIYATRARYYAAAAVYYYAADAAPLLPPQRLYIYLFRRLMIDASARRVYFTIRHAAAERPPARCRRRW